MILVSYTRVIKNWL